MKKILITCLIFISLQLFCFGADVQPRYSTSVKHFGIGVVQLSNLTKIYEGRDDSSEIIQKIYWDNHENYKTYDGTPASSTFIVYVPRNNKAFLSVEDEDDEWYYVCYNQYDELYGWIKKGNDVKYYTWFDFIDILGRKNGLYVFNDIKPEYKVLYAGPEDDAQIVNDWQYPKSIKPWRVNGNWAMVKLIDFDGSQKTGYLKWRNEDGTLNAFVKFK